MARIPRFQESGLISADVPRLDFANLREEASGYSTMSDSLDKLASAALGKIEKERKEANKLLGIQLRADMELEVQKQIDNLSGAIDRNELTYEQTQREIQAMQGFARGVAEVDIEQASGLMRSISTSGNALLRKISDVETAKYAADVDVKSAQALRAISRNLQEAWGLYGKGQMNDEEMLNIEAGSRMVMHGVAGLSKATINKYLGASGEFEKSMNAARSAAFAKYLSSPEFAPDEISALTRMSSDDFGAFTNVAKGFKAEEVEEIKKAVAGEYVARAQAADRTRQQNKARNDLLFTELYRNYVSPNVSPAQKDAIRKELFKVADTSEEINKIINMSSASRDPLLFSNLREQIFRGQITDIKQLQKYVSVLSSDELNQLQTQFMSVEKDTESSVSRDIRRYAGVPDNAVATFNPKDAAYVKEKDVRDIYNGLVKKAKEENAGLPANKIKPIDLRALKDQAIDQYETVEKKNAAKAAATTNLENLTAEKKLKTPITAGSSISDLRATKKFTEPELEYIQQQIDIIKGVK